MSQKNINSGQTEQNVYQTGNTELKKRHRGLFAILIVTVVLLIGVVSVMGLLNIQLFRRVQELDPKSYAFRVTRVDNSATPATPEVPRQTPAGVPQLQLQHTQPATEALPQLPPLPLQEVYDNNQSSVVSVIGQKGSGTGVIVTDCGYLITDSSLLGDDKTAQIRFYDGSQLTAYLVGADALTRLAVMDVEAENLIPAVFADDVTVQVGDSVIAIGDPLGPALPGSMTCGYIAAIHRELDVDGRFVSLLQSNALAGNGNTGGPLLNTYGHVIAINSVSLGNLLSNNKTDILGCAIPSSLVKEIVDQILLQGYVSRRATLGFTVEQVSAFDQLYYKVPAGLYITSVDADASLQPGDILLRFAGQRVGDLDGLQQLLRGHHPGDTVTLTVYREGTQLELQLTLKESE